MSETRNEKVRPQARPIIRTEDVYMDAEIEDGITGYSEKLLSIVATFSNSGAPEGFNAQSMVGKSKRSGEVALRLFAVVDPATERFVHVGFQARGCLAMTGCASAVCEMVEGRTLDEALTLTPEDVKQAVDGVPWDKTHTLYFAVCAVRALVGDYHLGQGVTRAQLDARVPCDENSIDCIMCEHCSLRDTRIELTVKEAQAAAGAGAATSHKVAESWQAAKQTEGSAKDGSAHEAQASAQVWADEVEAPAAQTPAGQSTSAEVSFVSEAGEAAKAAADVVETTELEVEREARMREVAENNALAAVFDDVRESSRSSILVEPARWVDLGLVPEHMSVEDFEMLVYSYLKKHGDVESVVTAPDATPVAEDRSARATAAAASERVRRRSVRQARSARRSVGVPVFERDRAAEKEAEERERVQAEAKAQRARFLEEAERAALQAEAEEMAFDPEEDDPGSMFASLKLPEGYRLERIDGEYVLVPDVDSQGVPMARQIDCRDIAVLTGVRSYYLYDRTGMTDAYAHWAFLAAEDNPLVTFVDCVREDSRVYPRPLLSTSLTNEPFCMSRAQIGAVWEEVRASGEYDDIERTEASNGDVYFYSTKYLSPRLAHARAEWNSVGRYLNV